MRRLFAGVAIALTCVALAPREWSATKTVGHQGRSTRLRRVEVKPVSDELRVCGEHEIGTDRDPCIGANGRLDYQPGR